MFELVGSIGDIRRSLANFNEGARSSLLVHRVTSLLVTTKNWVYDPHTSHQRCFGPSKFVGYKNMYIEQYDKIHDDLHGSETKWKIEKVVGMPFTSDTDLITKLEDWADSINPGVMNNITRSKWKFVSLL